MGWIGCHVTAEWTVLYIHMYRTYNEGTHNKLPSYGPSIRGTPSWHGCQTRGQSDRGRHWREDCRSATTPQLGRYFCVDVCKECQLILLSMVNVPYNVESTVPVRGSQNLMRLSLLPDTRRPFVGCHSTHFTSQPWPTYYCQYMKIHKRERLPVSTLSPRLSSKDHMRTVESSLAVANRPSSGLKLKPLIASRCPFHAVKLFMLGWKYFIMPL